MSRKVKLFLIFSFIFLLTLTSILGAIIFNFDREIQSRLTQKNFAEPVEFYSAPLAFEVGNFLDEKTFLELLERFSYRKRSSDQILRGGDFSFKSGESCQSFMQQEESAGWHRCFLFRNNWAQQGFVIALEETDKILGVFDLDKKTPLKQAQLEPEIFAQFYGEKPILRNIKDLGEMPRYCLDAIVSIEDPNFFEHQGISFKAIFRAMFKNVSSLKFAQGGSTITQQLIKNYFLTSEKTLKRKIKELLMSVLIEFHASKEEILQIYLNLIYMGQNGVFEVRGYGAASQHYFGKKLEDTSLSECALLAAIVNSPGRFNPFNHPEVTKDRRDKVLDKMAESGMISVEEREESKMDPLPQSNQITQLDPTPYFVDAVRKYLKSVGIGEESGLKVYTTLDVRFQKIAKESVKEGIEHLETRFPKLKEHKDPLQAFLIASNPKTGEVKALIGGRSFATSPYNRAFEASRQIGSIMKPFVYLTAFAEDPDSEKYTPMTPLENIPFSHVYNKQTWTPTNYDKENIPEHPPLFYALKQSLNIPTAKLAIDIGLDKVKQTARDLGMKSPMQDFPALSLGAFEMHGTEVLESYNSLSQLGTYRPLQFVYFVKNFQNQFLYVSDFFEKQMVDAKSVAKVVSIMKETMRTGTAASTRRLGFDFESAGKTGTTNDTKDSWFCGFTPNHSTVSWVGFDDNASTGLTGASGALYIWTAYMKKVSRYFPNEDFAWPEGLQKHTITRDELLQLGIPEEKAIDTELVW